MPGETTDLYAPLIERDLDAVPAAAGTFLASHTLDELWVAVARFAVLSYSPSQHGKRAVMACRAAGEVREEVGERWLDLLVECARYASVSRQPWSEPPILDPPAIDPTQPRDLDELRSAFASGERERAERWLAARIAAGDDDRQILSLTLSLTRGDARLVADAALALLPLLGEKGRYALFRMPILEMLAEPEAVEIAGSIEELVARAIAEKGSIDSVRNVFIRATSLGGTARERRPLDEPRLDPYPLARDYAQTLIAHAVVRRFPPAVDATGFLAAVHWNLQHGESYEEWS